MPILNLPDTKSACSLAYTATKGETYIFWDRERWEVIDCFDTWTTGFRAIIIQPENKKRCITVLAFAGTDMLSYMDLSTDAKQATGSMPKQYEQALDHTRRCKSKYLNVCLTGHSLGGGLANYSSLMTRTPTTTINPAPLLGAFYHAEDSFKFLGEHNQITNYIAADSELVTSSPGIIPGKIEKVQANGNFITRHIVGNVATSYALPERPNWIKEAADRARAQIANY